MTDHYMLVITYGRGSCSAAYHWADPKTRKPLCGARISSPIWEFRAATPRLLEEAAARGQKLCEACAHPKIKWTRSRETELQRLADWNAAARFTTKIVANED